jgi:hypothetical protein
VNVVLAAVATALVSVAATGFFSWVKWILPRRKAEEQAERDRMVVWYGDPGIPGARQAVVAMPLRVEGVETGLVQVRDTVDILRGDVGQLVDRVNEANGTAKRTEGKVDDLIASGIVTKQDLLETAKNLAQTTRDHQTEILDTVKAEVASAGEVSNANKDELLHALADKEQ